MIMTTRLFIRAIFRIFFFTPLKYQFSSNYYLVDSFKCLEKIKIEREKENLDLEMFGLN
jgi:hypothetical protein